MRSSRSGRWTRRVAYGVIGLLLACAILGVLGVPDLLFFHWPVERRMAERTRRARFLQIMYYATKGRHGGQIMPRHIEKEMQHINRSIGNPFGRQYVAARLSGVLYVAEVPEEGDLDVCVLEESGTVWYKHPREDLVQEILKRGERLRLESEGGR